MEFDCYQHYFYDGFDTEEDFYKSTAPSEDIWKKFELLPTPPMSPTRTLSVSAAGSRGHLLSPGDKHLLSPGDKLSWLSKVLGQDEECEGQFLPDTEELFGINLSSIIIQDCMWSSFSASKQLEKVNERLSSSSSSSSAAHQAARVPPVAPQISVRAGKAHCASSSSSSVASPDASLTRTLASDCVDPASVLSVPAAVASSCRKLPAASSSGSESHSDSSDEDDDDEEDDEEIDVVTVESKQNRARLMRGRKPMTVTVRADPCAKRFHESVHRQQHNYAARSPDSEPEEEEEDDEEEYEEEPQCKRTFVESCQQQQAAACPSPSTSLSQSTFSTDSQSSDAEDTDRRRNHNFLERKRRNDLRSRFLALRDQVPGLVESAKTPKVAILTQATEYLAQLHTREKHQVLEKKRLKARQQQLLRKLAELKRS